MGCRFRDTRLRYFVNSIIPFSRESVHEALGAIWRAKEPFGAEEEVYALTFLTMLNAVTDRFSLIDRYFERGLASMGIELATTLVSELVTLIPLTLRLAGAGITSSLKTELILKTLQTTIARSHTTVLTQPEYDRLTAVQDSLTLGVMIPYLPPYVRDEFDALGPFLDRALEGYLGQGFTRDDLHKLAIVLEELRRKRGWDWVTPKSDAVAKYGRLMMTPARLSSLTLEELYLFPPFMIQGPMDEYATFVPEQPFLFLRMKELEFLDSVKRKYTNVTGDTVEVLLREYLESRQLVLEERLPSGLVGVKKSHPCHFEEAFASRRFSRRTREDIFAVLPNPAQERIELDLLANHTVGFSVIGEVKYVTRYANAEEYYYEGSDDKDAERDRLLNLSKYLNEHPNRRQALGIPRRNVVVPVFITNAIGPLFADTDGVVKACPLEVLQVQPFFDLAIAQAEEIRQRSNVL